MAGHGGCDAVCVVLCGRENKGAPKSPKMITRNHIHCDKFNGSTDGIMVSLGQIWYHLSIFYLYNNLRH